MFRLAGRAIHVVRRVSLARERGSLHRERGSDTQTARALLSGPEGSPGQAAVLEWWVAASAAVRQGTCQHGPGASSLASRARAARRAWWKTSSLRPLGLLALRRPLSAPDLAQGCSEHRPASANHSVGRAGRPYRPWFPHSFAPLTTTRRRRIQSLKPAPPFSLSTGVRAGLAPCLVTRARFSGSDRSSSSGPSMVASTAPERSSERCP